MKLQPLAIAFIFLMLLSACKETNFNHPFDNGEIKPEKVTDVQVKNIAGGAKISYKLQNDESKIAYVKAMVMGNKKKVEQRSSAYKRQIVIQGLTDTASYETKLIAVSKSEKESEPVILKINPLLPPIISIYKSIKIDPTFGGVKVFFNNKQKNKITLFVVKDSVDNYITDGTYSTQQKTGIFSVHGDSAKKTKYGVFVRDEYQNYSDTLFKQLTPLVEHLVPYDGFKTVPLPGDTYKGTFCGPGPSVLWNGQINVNCPTFQTKPGSKFPQRFTIDLGVKVRLSRFVVYGRAGGAGAFSEADPEIFELWGSNNPAKDGSYKNWTKLGRFHAIKPSGLPDPDFTQDDRHYAAAEGRKFGITNASQKPAVRYIRFKTIKTWTAAHSNGINLAELYFYGNILKKYYK